MNIFKSRRLRHGFLAAAISIVLAILDGRGVRV